MQTGPGHWTDLLSFDQLPADDEELYEQKIGPFKCTGGSAGTQTAIRCNPVQTGVTMVPGYSLERTEVHMVVHNPTSGIDMFSTGLFLSTDDGSSTPSVSSFLTDFPAASGTYTEWCPFEVNGNYHRSPVIHEVYTASNPQGTNNLITRTYSYDWNGLESFTNSTGEEGPSVFFWVFDQVGVNDYYLFIRQYWKSVHS